MKRFYFLYTTITCAVLIFSCNILFSEELAQGPKYNAFYFKKFFHQEQPKEYYKYPAFEDDTNSMNSTHTIYVQPHILDDFSQKDTWDIDSPSEHFQNSNTGNGFAGASELLKWVSFSRQESFEKLSMAPPANTNLPSPEKDVSTILGVRSLFLSTGTKQIVVYPKTPLDLKPYPKQLDTIEVWVFSVNIPYKAYALIEDPNHSTQKIYLGTLDFFGWKRLIGQADHAQIKTNKPNTIWTKALLSISKFKALEFVSMNKDQSAGFFGVWLSHLTAIYSNDSMLNQDSYSSRLANSFDWDDDNNPGNNQNNNNGNATATQNAVPANNTPPRRQP